ncbi:response regulator [Patescibacteria group bacterium]
MEAIANVTSGVAHDFNNILTGFMGLAGLLVEVVPEESEASELADQIIEISEDARELTQQLLLFGGHKPLALKPEKLGKSLKGQYYKFWPKLVPENISLKLLCSKVLERQLVNVDLTEIKRVLINLIINSYHSIEEKINEGLLASGKGIIKIEFTFESIEGKLHFLITVEDNGMGIEEDVKSRIFEPYFTTKAKTRGTGLGLASVSKIVELHGGKVFCESERAVGTETGKTIFSIYLPLPESELSEQSYSALLRGSLDKFVSKKGERILVVEDDSMIRNILRRTLADRLNYNVLIATNGQEAVEVLKRSVSEDEKPFDLVITDYVMPRMSGLEFISYIMKNFPDIPVICMSGYEDRTREIKSITEGSNHVDTLPKPFAILDVAEKVFNLLNSRQI